jgi:ABC-type amino acid transport system permease subunit
MITSAALPVLNHLIEFTVHTLRGTPHLKTSFTVSVLFTIVAMLFNTYAMRRGAMIIGKDGRPLWRDLLDMPRLVVGFVLWVLRIQRSPQSL